MDKIAAHIVQTLQRVRDAKFSGRFPDSIVTLLAVSKRQSAAAIQAAYDSGIRDFGESTVQEALRKLEDLESLNITWHFIGQIQSNKTRDIARNFQWVHAVDRLKIATRLNDQRPHNYPPLNVCLQVNQAGEAQKAGVSEADVSTLARNVISLPRLRLRGLMTLPPANTDPKANAILFARLRDLKDTLVADSIPLDTLSMGMSADFEVAVREGSTIVRIGTAIFGKRDSPIKTQ